MKDNVTISAVVPVYNVENYLEDCLESIASQTISFDEVLLINDGSTDNSAKICEEYCERYHHFKLINQKNAGLSEARNTGIRLSEGNYIIFIDSDDFIRKDMILQLKKVLRDNVYDVVFYNADVCYEERTGESSNYFKRGESFYKRDMTGIDYLMESFPRNYIVSACVAVYKKTFIQANDIYFPQGIFFEDNAFSLKIYILARRLRCIDEALYIRRCRIGSIMADIHSYQKCRDLIKINIAIYDVLQESHINVLFQIHMVSFYLINTWKRLRDSNFIEMFMEEWKLLLEVFCDRWLESYLSEDIELGDMLVLLIYHSACQRKKMFNISGIRENIEEDLTRKIKGLPLSDENKRIGIYGIGRHTERMLELYRKYVGEIKADVFFIVTENSGRQFEYRGYPLITCDNIPLDIDRVIISSLTYANDILEQLERVGIPEKIIYEMYADNEYCDILTIMDILQTAGSAGSFNNMEEKE